MRLGLVFAVLALLLTGCGEKGPPARPALWEISASEGIRGYLFGTIHTLDEDVAWRSEVFDRAFHDADTLVVEAAGITDAKASERIWRRLAFSPNLPPLTQRVAPGDAAALKAALDKAGLKESAFAGTESWAAALTLAKALRQEDGEGIDIALLKNAKGKQVTELEGVMGQLAIFDRLAEEDQSALLAAVARSDPGEEARLATLWRAGDIDGIAAETHKGILADPDLREALLVARNRVWEGRIESLLEARRRPFVAVGAAHLAGPDGLPAMLAERGYTVRRIQ